MRRVLLVGLRRSTCLTRAWLTPAPLLPSPTGHGGCLWVRWATTTAAGKRAGRKPSMKGVPTSNEGLKYLNDRYGIDVQRVSARYPALQRYSRQRVEALTAYLEELGVDVRRVVTTRPSILSVEPQSLKEKMRWMQGCGLDVVRVVNLHPDILHCQTAKLEAKMELIATSADAIKVINRCPTLLRVKMDTLAVCYAAAGPENGATLSQGDSLPTADTLPKLPQQDLQSIVVDPKDKSNAGNGSVQNQLLPAPVVMAEVVDYLKARGLNTVRLFQVNPNMLGCRPTVLWEKIAFLEENGLDLARHLHIAPTVLNHSCDRKLRPMLRFILEDMGRSRAEVDGYPMLWNISLEKRLRPRFRYLQSLGRGQGDYSLRDLTFPRDEVFCRKLAGRDVAHFHAWRDNAKTE
eukprot:EG_transcript_13467